MLIVVLAIVIVTFIFQDELMAIYVDKKSRDACSYYSKIQGVRLLDIFVLGPFSIYVGYAIINKKDIKAEIGYMLVLYGIMNIFYNGKNYLANKKYQK